jgi:hypothetical protein
MTLYSFCTDMREEVIQPPAHSIEILFAGNTQTIIVSITNLSEYKVRNEMN